MHLRIIGTFPFSVCSVLYVILVLLELDGVKGYFIFFSLRLLVTRKSNSDIDLIVLVQEPHEKINICNRSK